MRYWTDAATKNNGNYGNQESWICVADEQGKILVHGKVGDKTNIQAEGEAILWCMKYIRDYKLQNAEIISDNQFWVKLLNYVYFTSKPHLIGLALNLRDLKKECSIRVNWKPREYNLAGQYLEKVHDEARWKREQIKTTTIDKQKIFDYFKPYLKTKSKKHLQEILNGLEQIIQA